MQLKQTLGASAGTRARILEAASVMFAKRGVSHTTLREITKAAKVNMAAVNYHFGSKEALANAVFMSVSEQVNAKRRQQIAACRAEAEADGRNPDLRELIDIFLAPYVDAEEPWTAMLLVHLLMLHRIDPSPWTHEVIAAQFDTLAQDFVEALHLAAPHLSRADVYWRYYFMPGTVVFAMTDARRSNRLARLSNGECDPADWNAVRRELRAVLVNTFEGPSSADEGDWPAKDAGQDAPGEESVAKPA